MNLDHRPWTPREVELLGTDTDAVIAARIGRGPGAVRIKRWGLGIPAHGPHRREWTKRELSLLGTMTDTALAERLGVSREHVRVIRRQHGVECYSPANRPGRKKVKRKVRAKP